MRVPSRAAKAHGLPQRDPGWGCGVPCLVDVSAEHEGPGIAAIEHQAGHVTGGIGLRGQQAVCTRLAQLDKEWPQGGVQGQPCGPR